MNAGDRTEIAAAVNATGLVKVAAYYRQNIKPGDGFVTWVAQAIGEDGIGFVDTWQVWVALAKSVADAEKWLDTNLTTLRDALDTELTVTTIRAGELPLGANTVNGVILEGAR